MKVSWFNEDIVMFFVALTVLIAVPVWIRWMTKREEAILRSRRVVHDKVCQLCSNHVSFVAHMEFDAYERRNPLVWERVTYAAPCCHDCAIELVEDVRRTNINSCWTFLAGPLGLALTWSNSGRARKDYEHRMPKHDTHPEEGPST